MRLKHIYLCNAFHSRTIHEIKKHDITNRTELNGFEPTELYIVAQKVNERKDPLILQQGDYEQKWIGNRSGKYFCKKAERNIAMGDAVCVKAFWSYVAVEKDS